MSVAAVYRQQRDRPPYKKPSP